MAYHEWYKHRSLTVFALEVTFDFNKEVIRYDSKSIRIETDKAYYLSRSGVFKIFDNFGEVISLHRNQWQENQWIAYGYDNDLQLEFKLSNLHDLWSSIQELAHWAQIEPNLTRIINMAVDDEI